MNIQHPLKDDMILDIIDKIPEKIEIVKDKHSKSVSTDLKIYLDILELFPKESNFKELAPKYSEILEALFQKNLARVTIKGKFVDCSLGPQFSGLFHHLEAIIMMSKLLQKGPNVENIYLKDHTFSKLVGKLVIGKNEDGDPTLLIKECEPEEYLTVQ